ncbi:MULTISPECIES: hypothetical protein [unclassified Clostridioides]|uniref:hypothetical protein n=1 Tax=unclassified Clostridioides TaxID=2635829 RepID=UPI001D127AF2|nr:hypothetical protein [Clostridioides difficile]
MEIYNIIGLNISKIIVLTGVAIEDKSKYQLSSINNPQNNEIVLFSLTLQDVIYVISISNNVEIIKGMMLCIFR